MVKVAVFDFPNPGRDAYLMQQPLCEHSLEVGKSMVISQLGFYGMALVKVYNATPKWRVLSRWKQRTVLAALKEQALTMLDHEEEDDE